MGKKKDNEQELYGKLLNDGYTYTLGKFSWKPSEMTGQYNSISGKDNYKHSAYEFGEKTDFTGGGSSRVYDLPELIVKVQYYKGPLRESSQDKGEFNVDVYRFIKFSVQRSNGGYIRNLSDKFVDNLNKALDEWGDISNTSPLKLTDVLPPDMYLKLLLALSNSTELVVDNVNVASLGVGICDKLSDSDDGEGVIAFRSNRYYIPMVRLRHTRARVGDKGDFIYYREKVSIKEKDEIKENFVYGYAFKPFD